MEYGSVTELSGQQVSAEQVERTCHRYAWAASHCAGKDVLELACGDGIGLRYLASVARTVEAGDIDPNHVAVAQRKAGDAARVQAFPADDLPFPDASQDVVVLLEALYYLPDADRFMSEAARVLRPDGTLLIATANKDLYDFNPSPKSVAYYGTVELADLYARHGFTTRLQGYLSVGTVSPRQRLLRPAKAAAVRLGIMPQTMKGKTLLKRLMFGRLVEMPEHVDASTCDYTPPPEIDATRPDHDHKVIYAAGARG